MDKPDPRINAINRPFWEACNRDELLLQRCKAPSCGRFIYFPRVCCPYCGGGDLEWARPSGCGRIVSFTRVQRPQHQSFFAEAPYYFFAVELAEGPPMYSRLDRNPKSEDGLIGRAGKFAIKFPYSQTCFPLAFKVFPALCSGTFSREMIKIS